MSDLKNSKDALVASLFELSKAAQEAAAAAVNFYKTANVDALPADQLAELSASLGQIAKATISNGETLNPADVAAAAVRRRGLVFLLHFLQFFFFFLVKDPNAPKKPLTMYFAFAYHTRKQIAEEREKKGLGSLNAIEMNSIVKDRWMEISAEEKQKWQDRYRSELKDYNVLKEKYQTKLEDDKHDADVSIASLVPVVEEEKPEVKIPVVEPPKVESSSSEAPKKSHKKRKSDKERSEKKKKKSSSSSSSHAAN
ncbi:HMO1 [[Candida] subhashii]|uniref:HMO1 n=1 Tax=[Candida] subhashii TaxID=561895 RepID=A0A8J5UW07_9ASCO|nr:HMO1 [[Candida] subhashii]KAG7662630.1 HMO1 [[Candida] subhashii]